jgi:hypothetical protein
VSQEIESACGSVRLALTPASTLWKTWLPSVKVLVQGIVEYGLIRRDARPASATIGLKVEPVDEQVAGIVRVE